MGLLRERVRSTNERIRETYNQKRLNRRKNRYAGVIY